MEPPPPIITETIPANPWQRASADLGNLPDGRHMLVVIDDFSKYPEVELLESTVTERVIPCLEKIMATHGIIQELRTDNGPPFSSHEFASYLASHAIQHRKITPRWPQANGEAERFMRTLNKVLRIAVGKGKNLDCAIFEFLREYRLTPHSTTGVSPSSICIQREVRDTIPHVEITTMKQKQVETKLRNRHIHNERISRKRGARMRNLKVGDVVLVKNRHPGGKFKTPFEPEVWTVARVKGTLVTATRKDETVTRNISWFKIYHGRPLESERSEVNSGPPSSEEGVLTSGHVQASGELEERDTTSLKVPERSEERTTAEVPSAINR
ncbi:hypothetical protein NDU88_002646 [Pleurodeles waltl]|uniref:Integrase catalytic domain-containing protein n=1 Tax=Pleurodeles waltl TaxID=8319 RepID=A0AAV7VDE8_PLEWA|nr:hypothetical protein NDU88_002646 [Pleurodeles waltl]